MISGGGFYFNTWKPPHEEPTFKATLEGIKRDIGTRKRKQPPLEADRMAGILDSDEATSEVDFADVASGEAPDAHGLGTV